MKPNKNPILLGTILLITVLAYSFAIFMLATDKGANFWIGYSFTILAFLLQLLSFVLTFSNKETLQRKTMRTQHRMFLRLPIQDLAIRYLIVQLFLGLVITFLPQFNTTLAIVLSIIVLAVFLVLLISTYIASDAIISVDKKVGQKTFYIKSQLAAVEHMHTKTEDPVLKKLLRSLEDTIKYSDPMSHDSLAVLENEIETKVAQLGEVIGFGKTEESKILVNEIVGLFEERNKKCKLMK
mgnify:CR=1 FL=1